MTEKLPDALILGMSETGLGALRLLSSAGLRCWGLDTLERAPAYHSRYCRRSFRLLPETTSSEIVALLLRLAREHTGNIVLVPTSDRFVRLISAARSELAQAYCFALPDHERVQDLLNKARFAERTTALGISTPRTKAVCGTCELACAAAEIGLPFLVKLSERTAGQPPFPKTVVVHSEHDRDRLIERFDRVQGIKLVVQEYIPGDDRDHRSVALCMDASSRPVASFVARKLRQGSEGAGVGTCVESLRDDEAERIAVSALQRLQFQGFAEVELKRHADSGTLYVIEINPRLWTQVTLAAAVGINFPLLYFALARGELPAVCTPNPRRVVWQDLWDDFYVTFSSAGYWRRGLVSPLGWLCQTLRVRAHPYYCVRDPRPGFVRFGHVMRQLQSASPLRRKRRG